MIYRIFFKLNQGLYWLALGTWFGSIVMLVLAAAITFKTVREYEPALTKPPYNDPALVERSSDILAGAIVGQELRALGAVQAACAIVVVICTAMQLTVFSSFLWAPSRRCCGLRGGACNWLRVILIAIPIVTLSIQAVRLDPRLQQHRQVMNDPSKDLATREAARAMFGEYHRQSVRMTGAAMLSLAAALIVSGFVLHEPRPKATEWDR